MAGARLPAVPMPGRTVSAMIDTAATLNVRT